MMATACIASAVAGANASPASGKIFCLQAMFPEDAATGEHFQEHPLQAFAATANPDTLCCHEAMRASDRNEFIKAMQEEVQAQLTAGIYKPTPQSQVPEGAIVFPAVWSLHQKCKVKTGEICRWKGRLNFGGHKQVKGHDFEQTHAPAASWSSIHLLLSMVLLHNWDTRSMDCILACPQAPLDSPSHMESPQGFEVPDENGQKMDCALELNRNSHGRCDGSRTWNICLVKKLKSVSFAQSTFDECMFCKGRSMCILHADDSILAGPDSAELDDVMRQIQATGLKITSEGGLEDFLGVECRPQG